jgi:hypothetical protein
MGLQPYHGGVSSVQGLWHVGSSSTSFSSMPCRRHITWMFATSMGGGAAVSMQCVPHCSMLSSSDGDSRKPAADRGGPTGRSIVLYLPWPRSFLSETRPCPRGRPCTQGYRCCSVLDGKVQIPNQDDKIFLL